MPSQPDPRTFLPLTSLTFEILLALAGGARHGYAIVQAIEAHSEGVRLRTGTLYTALQRLLEASLIEEAERGPAGDDSRRRYYTLTPVGRTVLEAEARRLEGLVSLARRERVLGRPSRA